MGETIAAGPLFTARQYQILNAWRILLEDIRHLCRALNALPDDCPCGDARAHLADRCVCCQRATNSPLPACHDCDKLLATLTPTFSSLAVDTWQFFPSVREFLSLRERQTGMVFVGVTCRLSSDQSLLENGADRTG